MVGDDVLRQPDGYGRLPDLNLPEKLFWEQPEPRSQQVNSEQLQQLSDAPAGKIFGFPGGLELGSQSCSSIMVEKIFHSASNARLLHLQPGNSKVILKFADVRREAAIMSALKKMNELWKKLEIRACGKLVQTLTYEIYPLGEDAGYVEAVGDAWNLRELAKEPVDRHMRVVKVLPDADSLNTLAASTVAYLTSGYALGLHDSHDDNIMLRSDGFLFRVDFGYVFGASPALDAPPTVVPNAVLVALGEARWKEVSIVCERALMAVSGDGEAPGWACVRAVPEMALLHHEAYQYVQGLSLEDFREEVRNAKDWSMSRFAKNRLREVVRYWRHGEERSERSPKSAAGPRSSVRQIQWLQQPGGDGDLSPCNEEDEAQDIKSLNLPESLGLEDFDQL